ncbi:hypothetical protein FJT64_009398 [Amphibalanus amphitrite]|uniref:Uncharacterized protein n=1 Tax=Amphibalanus amphitrite TaxID=1232801 RepID=A0A6A4VM31_AMPAM|nr:hypothetical protein FJT64_009398 [Amphibalanus amphitrite]
MLDMSRVPVKSKQPPPPRALKLPTISAAAMQALANRATMVSVDEVVFPHAPPVDGARGQPRYPPLSPAAYLRGVTAIATYRAYFFPGAAIQWLSYVLWLQGQAGDLPTSALRDIDVKARTHIARYHMEYQDPASLTEAIGQALAAPAVYAPAPAPSGRAAGAAPSSAPSGELCQLQYLGGPAAAAAGGEQRERAATRARLTGAALLGVLSRYIVQPMPGKPMPCNIPGRVG